MLIIYLLPVLAKKRSFSKIRAKDKSKSNKVLCIGQTLKNNMDHRRNKFSHFHILCFREKCKCKLGGGYDNE